MATLTAPAPQAHIAVSNNGEKPINLFQLGCLFVIRASYWSCRIGNEPQDFHGSCAHFGVNEAATAGLSYLDVSSGHPDRQETTVANERAYAGIG